jgi:DNA-binding transcriptional LysR family regulator
MQTFQRKTTQQLTLWCNSSAQSEYLPMLLPKYLIEHAQLQIELHEAESNDIIAALQKGQAELGLISSFFAPNDALETHVFAEDPLVFICAPDHPLATHRQLNFAAILKEDFIGLWHIIHYNNRSKRKPNIFITNCTIVYAYLALVRWLKWSPMVSVSRLCHFVLLHIYKNFILFLQLRSQVHGRIANYC